MDRGTWQATAHGVTQSQTQLKRLARTHARAKGGSKKEVVILSLPKHIAVFWSFSGQSMSPANQMPSVCMWTLQPHSLMKGYEWRTSSLRAAMYHFVTYWSRRPWHAQLREKDPMLKNNENCSADKAAWTEMTCEIHSSRIISWWGRGGWWGKNVFVQLARKHDKMQKKKNTKPQNPKLLLGTILCVLKEVHLAGRKEKKNSFTLFSSPLIPLLRKELYFHLLSTAC